MFSVCVCGVSIVYTDTKYHFRLCVRKWKTFKCDSNLCSMLLMLWGRIEMERLRENTHNFKMTWRRKQNAYSDRNALCECVYFAVMAFGSVKCFLLLRFVYNVQFYTTKEKESKKKNPTGMEYLVPKKRNPETLSLIFRFCERFRQIIWFPFNEQTNPSFCHLITPPPPQEHCKYFTIYITIKSLVRMRMFRLFVLFSFGHKHTHLWCCLVSLLFSSYSREHPVHDKSNLNIHKYRYSVWIWQTEWNRSYDFFLWLLSNRWNERKKEIRDLFAQSLQPALIC